MSMRDILERQANSVEYVLHTHGIDGRVDGGRLSPRLAHLSIVLPPGVRPNQLAPLVPEFAEAIGVTACRLAAGPGGVGLYLEVPRPDPVPVRLVPLVQRVADVVPPITATLGLDTEGTPLLLRLNAPDVDPVVVVGNDGAGKSRLLRGIATSLSLHNSPDNLRLLLLDATGDGTAFREMDRLPHLACPAAIGTVDTLVSLRWALRALTRREAARDDFANPQEDDDTAGELFFDDEPAPHPSRSSPANMEGEPALVVLLDGVDVLLGQANRRAAMEALAALNRLLADGGRHGIHVVLASERPDLPLDSQWGARITGWTLSPEMARLSTGVRGSGAQGLLGAGDFLISLNAELIRFQAAAISSSEVARAVDLIISQTEAPEQAPPRPAQRQAQPGQRPRTPFDSPSEPLAVNQHHRPQPPAHPTTFSRDTRSAPPQALRETAQTPGRRSWIGE